MIRSLPSRPKGKILVVDDELEITSVLAEVLSQDGYDVDVALNGALALEKLREGKYDLILSDLSMPVLDGLGLHRELQRDHSQFLGRVIFMTGALMKAETQEFLDRTGVPCLSKPLDFAEVVRMVRDLLKRHWDPQPRGLGPG